MSPQLQALLAALYERDHCEPEEFEACSVRFERLLEAALGPDCSRTQRDEFLTALRGRYRDYCRAQRRPPTLPPQA